MSKDVETMVNVLSQTLSAWIMRVTSIETRMESGTSEGISAMLVRHCLE